MRFKLVLLFINGSNPFKDQEKCFKYSVKAHFYLSRILKFKHFFLFLSALKWYFKYFFIFFWYELYKLSIETWLFLLKRKRNQVYMTSGYRDMTFRPFCPFLPFLGPKI